MSKKKNKQYHLNAPSLFRRVWITWLYNIICSAIVFGVFFGFYSLYDVAFELDFFMMFGFRYVRYQIVTTCLTFWFAYRQFFKDCNLIRYTHKSKKRDSEIITEGGYKRMYEGDEGTGKTMAIAYDTLFLAAHKDGEMLFRYYLLCPYADKLAEDVDFNVLKDTVQMYNDHPEKIPHYMANFNVEYDGRTQYHWDDRYLDAELRLPEGMAIALTELANILPNAWSRVPREEDKDTHKMLTKAKILSLTRQYYDAHIVGDDQRAGEVALQWRSVVSKTVDIVDRPKVLTPHFLEFIEEHIKRKIMKRGERNTKFLTFCYNAIHYLVQNIGFYVYIYDLKESETGRVIKENQSFVIPCHLPFKYDTRGQRKKFKLYPRKPDLVDKSK